ncbi:MAG: chemotaxis protein CheB [Caldilineaceae bacterium]|nr:chemotaxis protein CheB [Caldilineaceae bacterium]
MNDYAVVVIGTSAGGTAALPELVGQLPADLPAAIFVVQHLYAEAVTILPRLLNRASALPAHHPQDGEVVEPGRIYVAPPDYHLLLHQPGVVELSRGARENLHRPAIDPLFRTAARVYGMRTIGVLLTGTRDDGVAGLMAVKMRGGIAIVQDPADAAYGEMPQSALEQVDGIDSVAPLSEIPGLIIQNAMRVVRNGELRHGKEEGMADRASMREQDIFGEQPHTLICPECGGGLQLNEQGRLIQFQCHVGHVFGLDSLRAAYGEQIEHTLWAAMRAFKEQIILLERMAANSNNARLRDEYLKQAQAALEHTKTVHYMLQNLNTPSVPGQIE